MRSRRTTIAGISCGLVCALSVFAYTQSVNDQAEQGARRYACELRGKSRWKSALRPVIWPRRDCSLRRGGHSGRGLPISCPRRRRARRRTWLANSSHRRSWRGSPSLCSVSKAKRMRSTCPRAWRRFRFLQGTCRAWAGRFLPARALTCTPRAARRRAFCSRARSCWRPARATASSTSSSSWVTLAVNPDRVQELVDASQRTELYFAVSVAAGEEDAS